MAYLQAFVVRLQYEGHLRFLPITLGYPRIVVFLLLDRTGALLQGELNFLDE